VLSAISTPTKYEAPSAVNYSSAFAVIEYVYFVVTVTFDRKI